MNDSRSQPKENEPLYPIAEDLEEPGESYRRKALKKRSLLLFPLSYLGFVLILGTIFGIGYTLVLLTSSGGAPGVSLENGLADMTYILLYLDAIGFTIAFLLFKSVRSFIFEKMSLDPLKNKVTYIWILVGVGLIFSAQILIFEVWQLETPHVQNQLFGVTPENFSILTYILLLLNIALITPIKEELLFRGFLLRFFEAKYTKAWLGILISSTVFGVLHPGYPLVGVVMGLVFAGLYIKTNSIIVPIVAHIIWNTYVGLVSLTFLL